MAGTRSSTAKTANQGSRSESDRDETPEQVVGTKRKGEMSPTTPSKRSTPDTKKQKTLEQTLQSEERGEEGSSTDKTPDFYETDPPKSARKTNGGEKGEETAESIDDADASQANGEGKQEHNSHKDGKQSNGAVANPKERERAKPQNILEKGIIYFFFRGRVNTDDVESVQDVARSYMVLRPLPDGAKLGDGPIPDAGNNILLALPKKVLPKGGQDRFMTFVEKAEVSLKELKEEFFEGSEYSTKTTGVSHTPPVTPIGEGIYAITTTGNETHLVYLLTLPEELAEVQEEMGLRDRGSFILSLKNPKSSGPANATLPQGAEFTKDIMEEFRGRSWMPPEPKHLKFVNAQFIMIGGSDERVAKATEPTRKDEREDKDAPLEHLEKLQREDEQRTEKLAGNAAIFEDLNLSKKDFPKVKTTW